MKDEKEKEEQERPEKDEKEHKVRVTAYYTATADEKDFNADLDDTLQKVIKEAYNKLGETPRPGDQVFCHDKTRHDLKPYLSSTLKTMKEKGVCVHDAGRGKLELEFDIDTDTGGAARK